MFIAILWQINSINYHNYLCIRHYFSRFFTPKFIQQNLILTFFSATCITMDGMNKSYMVQANTSIATRMSFCLSFFYHEFIFAESLLHFCANMSLPLIYIRCIFCVLKHHKFLSLVDTNQIKDWTKIKLSCNKFQKVNAYYILKRCFLHNFKAENWGCMWYTANYSMKIVWRKSIVYFNHKFILLCY